MTTTEEQIKKARDEAAALTRYADALEHGLSDGEAQGDGWPDPEATP